MICGVCVQVYGVSELALGCFSTSCWGKVGKPGVAICLRFNAPKVQILFIQETGQLTVSSSIEPYSITGLIPLARFFCPCVTNQSSYIWDAFPAVCD